MKVLIVGAGAVGQVYGHFLQRGGASVSCLVKEKHQRAAEEGFTLYRCRRRGLGPGERFLPEQVITQPEQVTADAYDQVWLATSSVDLHGGWLERLRDNIGDATVVMLQPDIDDRDYVFEVFGAERVVCGLVNFISYQTPLPELPTYHPDAQKYGVAYLFMPLMPAEFSGVAERLTPVLQALDEGRLQVKVRQDASRIYADRSAMMMPLVAALELEEWSFQRLQSSANLALAVRAGQEALAVVAAKFGRSPNLRERLFSRFWVQTALPIMRWLAPMDAEAYVRFQFVKTAPQTRYMLNHFIEEGGRYGLATNALRSLVTQLPPLPANTARAGAVQSEPRQTREERV